MLEGIVVVEFGRIFSAPLCGMILSDLGARVIKVERKSVGDESRNYGIKMQNGMSDYFFALNRKKETVLLDLKDEDDNRTALELIKGADVLIHNTLQASFDKLGLSYRDVNDINPRIIYAAINGYGGRSSFKNNPSQDVIIQGLSGFMSLNGFPDGMPLKTGIPVIDYVTGQYAAIGILSALIERNATGLGKLINVSLLESAMSMLSIEAVRLLNMGVVTTRNGNRHTSISPYNSYQTKDGHVLIAIANDVMFKSFSKAIDLDQTGYETNEKRLSRISELDECIQKKTMGFFTADLIKLLKENKVSAGPIHDLRQAFDSAEARELDLIGELDGYKYVKTPVNF